MIVGFNDTQNFFLNNKYSCSVHILNRRFGNAEAAFQAHKTKESQIRNIFTTLDAVSAQSLGRDLVCYNGWENDRLRVMLLVIFEKFRQNSDILTKLINTENQKLVAVSISQESYWGTHNGEGKNMLGKILMYIREYFKTNSPFQREYLESNWEDIQTELNVLKIPLKNYGILYNPNDILKINNSFEDCFERLETLKIDMKNYMDFFLITEDSLNKATEKFTD